MDSELFERFITAYGEGVERVTGVNVLDQRPSALRAARKNADTYGKGGKKLPNSFCGLSTVSASTFQRDAPATQFPTRRPDWLRVLDGWKRG